MSEHPIAISKINDFIFCPVSIYFHALEEEENVLVQNAEQKSKGLLEVINMCKKYGFREKMMIFYKIQTRQGSNKPL